MPVALTQQHPRLSPGSLGRTRQRSFFQRISAQVREDLGVEVAPARLRLPDFTAVFEALGDLGVHEIETHLPSLSARFSSLQLGGSPVERQPRLTLKWDFGLLGGGLLLPRRGCKGTEASMHAHSTYSGIFTQKHRTLGLDSTRE